MARKKKAGYAGMPWAIMIRGSAAWREAVRTLAESAGFESAPVYVESLIVADAKSRGVTLPLRANPLGTNGHTLDPKEGCPIQKRYGRKQKGE